MIKVSNKGWQTHQRVVTLDENHLSYYRKVPKEFEEDKFEALESEKPKQVLKLLSIVEVCQVAEEDTKKFMKLKDKKAGSIFIKIIFSKDGLVKQAKDGDQDHDSDDSAGDIESSNLKN